MLGEARHGALGQRPTRRVGHVRQQQRDFVGALDVPGQRQRAGLVFEAAQLSPSRARVRARLSRCAAERAASGSGRPGR